MVKRKSLKNDAKRVFVENSDGLASAVKQMQPVNALGIDLEADSMFHFREKVCLIQIAVPDTVFIIDPLTVKDLSPLQAIIGNRHIKKIFHGADYDVRSLYRDFGIDIQNLFDTEVACRFLGMAQTSLEKVVRIHFDETLTKQYQKKDWSQRPLPDEMIEYAAKDAFFLIPLCQLLEKELKARKRLGWVVEECELLSRVRSPEPVHSPMYMHFKGAGRLDPRSLAILEELLVFRRDLAEKYDRPLFKVFGNRSLLLLASQRPVDTKALEKSRTLSARQIQRYGRTVLDIIRNGLELPENDLPRYPRGKVVRYRASVTKRIKALKTWKEEKAAGLKIDPALILTKAQAVGIAILNPGDLNRLGAEGILKKWQLKEFGREIIGVLKQV